MKCAVCETVKRDLLLFTKDAAATVARVVPLHQSDTDHGLQRLTLRHTTTSLHAKGFLLTRFTSDFSLSMIGPECRINARK
jgi:hypothetical protein